MRPTPRTSRWPTPFEWGLALILLALASCAPNRFEKVSAWRYAFVRNALPDTAVVSLFSPSSERLLVMRVAPGDSACGRVPFFDTTAILTIQAMGMLDTRQVAVRNPGIDWIAVGPASQAQPALGSCLAIIDP